MVKVTETANGNDEGDLLFPISDEGAEQLQPLFDNIASACGTLAKRDTVEPSSLTARQRLRRTLRTRDNSAASCAYEMIQGSEFSAYDVGASLSMGTITAGEVAVAVDSAAPAALVIFSLWLLGKGFIEKGASVRIPAANVASVNDAVAQPSDGNSAEDDDDDDDILPRESAFVNLDVEISDEDMQANADELTVDWYTTPYWLRELTHSWSIPDLQCQESDTAAPQYDNDGTPSVHATMMDWCGKYSGKQLDPNGISTFFDRYTVNDNTCKSPDPQDAHLTP
jgi:hypothetical protein